MYLRLLVLLLSLVVCVGCDDGVIVEDAGTLKDIDFIQSNVWNKSSVVKIITTKGVFITSAEPICAMHGDKCQLQTYPSGLVILFIGNQHPLTVHYGDR